MKVGGMGDEAYEESGKREGENESEKLRNSLIITIFNT